MHYTLVWGSFCQIWWPQGISKEFDLWLTLADPCMTSDPAMSYTLIKGSSYQIWWPYSISKQFDPLVDPGWPLHDLWPQQCITLWSGVLPTKFGGHRALLRWPLLDPSWPLHDLRPQQCITLWSEVLPTKFGDHRALLSKLTPTWPQLTPTWPLTPAMHYGSVRDSSHQIWWPKGISKQFDPWLTPDDPCMTFDPSSALRFGQGFFLPNLVAIEHF